MHTAFQIDGPQDREYIAFSGDEVTRCKEGDDALPGIFPLGFAPRSCVVDPSQNMQPSRFMRPDETRAPGSTQLYGALWNAMLEEDDVAFCKLQRKGRVATLVAVVQQREVLCAAATTTIITTNITAVCPDGFNVIYLPWNDEIRPRKATAPRE